MWIVLEGIDGSGKTTLAKNLTDTLNGLDEKNKISETPANNFLNVSNDYVYISEPTQRSIEGKKIREILSGEKRFPGQKKMLELFFKDRLFNLSANIATALHKKKHVIQDRYFFSTAAYQGKNSTQAIEILQTYLDDTRFLFPDYVFFLDLKPKQALERINQRTEQEKQKKEIFETEKKMKLTYENYLEVFKVYKNFLLQNKPQKSLSAEIFSENVIFLDATLSSQKLEKKIIETVFIK